MLSVARLVLAAYQNVVNARALGEFDEEKHPRDDKGKFTSGGGDAGVVVKQKAAHATKDQIAKAMEMKKAGASYAAIHAATGLNPKQAATIVHKANKKEKEIKEKLAQPAAPVKATDPYKETATTYVSPVSGKVFDKATGNEVKAPTPEQKGEKSGEHTLYAGTDKQYVWQEKTPANSPGMKPENAGKWAYFDKATGQQVSSPMAKDESKKAEATIHQGKGKDYAPPAPKEQTLGTVTKGAAIPDASVWPIPDSANRVAGSNYPNVVQAAGEKWAAGLTPSERAAVASYTGSAYASVNDALRKSPDAPLSGTAKSISSALGKSKAPPPPELVWRGVSGHGAAAFVSKLEPGDVIRMDGFQSTSIKPEFAHSWGGGAALFEIKPAKGAYVRPVSNHKSEYEYLLPHGATYTVRGHATVKLNGHATKVVQLEMHA